MWCQGELDSRLGFPAYGCVELDDNFSPIQPTFPTQGLESLFNESCLSSLSDNFGEFVSQTGGIPTDYSTIFPSQQQSLNNFLSYGSHQDTSGTDSSVCGLTDHHSPSIGTGPELKNVCLLPSEILDFPQEDWTESEDKQVKPQHSSIKKECNSPTQKKEDWNWISELNFADGNCTFTNGVSFTSTNPVAPQSTLPVIKRRKLTVEQNLLRRAKVARYLEKRKRRNWGHTIRYASRKAYAENRPRIKGRFAKQEEVDALQKRKPKLEQKCKPQV